MLQQECSTEVAEIAALTQQSSQHLQSRNTALPQQEYSRKHSDNTAATKHPRGTHHSRDTNVEHTILDAPAWSIWMNVCGL